MRKIGLVIILLVVGGLFFSIKTLVPAYAELTATNLINNSSFEDNLNNLPTGWSKDKYGKNTTVYTYNNFGHTGTKSASVTISGYATGDAKWVPTSVSVLPNTNYTFSNWYQSNTTTYLDAVYKTTANKTVYKYLGSSTASTDWKQQSYTFKTPSNAKSITFYHYIKSNGTLTTDDYSLSLAQVVPTSTPTPTPVPTPTPTPIPTPTPTPVPTPTPTPIPTPTPTPVPTPTPTPIPTPTPTPVPTNLVPNSSVEQSVNNIPTNWSANSWGTNTTANTYELSGYTGSNSIKTTITSYTSGDAKWMFNAVSVTPGKTYNFSNYYKSNVDTEIDVMVNFSNGSTNYYYLSTALSSPNNWAKASGQFTMPVGAVSATVFQVLNKVGYVQSDEYSLSEYIPQKFNRAIISINFDDGWRSVYQNALPVLNKYGFATTQYILTETFDYPDYMDTAMILDLKNQGHEIGSHTVSHPHLTTLNTANLTNELAGSQAVLRQAFGASGVANNFASPYGEYNSTVINEVQKYYRSHRSTDVGYNTKDSFNIYNIKVQNILSTTTDAEVQGWVNQAIATNSWLVLVYHEVNSTSGGALYSTTTSSFDSHMNIVKNSGVTVKTTNQALDEITSQL